MRFRPNGAWVVFAFAACMLHPPVASGQNRWLSTVQELNLPSVPGEPATYYSPGAIDRARLLQDRLAGVIRFFSDSLGVVPTVNLAVLNREHWDRLQPGSSYGFAGNVGPSPWMIRQPSLSDSTTASILAAALGRVSPELRQRLDSTGLSPEAIMLRHVDLVIVHEYGHVVLRGALGIRYGAAWFQEYLATYLMYAYLRSAEPAWAQIADAWDNVVFAGARPMSTRVADYTGRVGEESRMWFFASTARQIRPCYSRHGLNFIRELQRRLPVSEGWELSTSDILAQLETLCPGTTRWALDMRLARE